MSVLGGGSSPLARGLPDTEHCDDHGPGIIPARAGFTLTYVAHHRFKTDHPRSRGVYDRRNVATLLAHGSSPLARGLRICIAVASLATGIIPARAGFTNQHSS